MHVFLYMRIGINGYYLSTPHSGIGQYTINLLYALSGIDKENQYYVFSPQKPAEWKLPENFNLILLPELPFFSKTFIQRFIWEEYQLGKAIKWHGIEVFHGLYQSLPKGSEQIGNVVTIHDAIPWRFPFERKQILYRWYSDKRRDLTRERAKKIITISETSKLDIAPIYRVKPETVEVTYESIDPIFWERPSKKEIEEFKQTHGITTPYILYTGGIKRHKNLRMLIKAFAILINEYQYKGRLYILGAKRNSMAVSSALYYNIKDLERYAALKGVADQVVFVGFVSRKDMSMYMQQAEAFISISLFEGFGLPALEAMTSGTPSVLSNLGAYPEIAQDAALFVYPYGPHRVAEALHKILHDKKLQQTLVKKGLERAKFFDSKKIAERVLQIYKEVYDDYKISFQP